MLKGIKASVADITKNLFDATKTAPIAPLLNSYLINFMANYSFATLITYDTKILISHINLLFEGDENEGYLVGHLARGNPQSKVLNKAPQVIATFTSDKHKSTSDPNELYAIYVEGDIQIINELERKKGILNNLVCKYEQAKQTPWQISWDENPDYEKQLNAIVFFSIKIVRLKACQMAQVVYPPLNLEPLTSEMSSLLAMTLNPVQTFNPVYMPTYFRHNNVANLVNLIKKNSIALLVTYTQNQWFVIHVPLKLDFSDPQNVRLIGQLPSDDKSEQAVLLASSDIKNLIVIFKGSHCYISPDYYQTLQNVPTWNYTSSYFIGKYHLSSDEPGVFLVIEQLNGFGKFKLSQNRTSEDHLSVMTHLSSSNDQTEQAVAKLMEQTCPFKF